MESPPQLPVLSIVPVAGRARGQLAGRLDGRYGPLDPGELRRAMAWLARQVDLEGVGHVLGIPEGGFVPAHAFALETGLRVVLASIWQPDVPGVVSFVEEHEPPAIAGKHILGLAAGDHVIVVEDEVTTGATVVSCVRALRAAGIRCEQVAALYAADDPAMHARLAAEGIRLHAVATYPTDARELLYRR